MSRSVHVIRRRADWGAIVRNAFLAFGLANATSAFAAKTDVVEFGAGNRLVGEVKGLDRGKLSFKTDATDTIEIDWADVTRLVTDQEIRVEARDGNRYFGSLAASDAPGMLAVVADGEAVTVPMKMAVVLDPIKGSVAQRIDFDISLGYSFAQSTGVETLSLASSTRYDTELVSRTLSLSSESTSSDSEANSTRNDAEYRALSLLDNRWFVGWIGQFESNDALALDHRVTAAAVGGRTFYPSANQRLRTFGGLGVNAERFEGNDTQTSLESLVGGTIDWFDFGESELDLSTTLTLFPSITEAGRVRGSLDVSLRWELFEDLFWQLTLFDDYDSRPEGHPGDEDPSNNDYGVTTGLGWSW